MMIDLNRMVEAIRLAEKVIRQYPSSSYTWYLLAKASRQAEDVAAARLANTNALKFDPDNADAKRLAQTLGPEQEAYNVVNRTLTASNGIISLSAGEGDGVAWLKDTGFGMRSSKLI